MCVPILLRPFVGAVALIGAMPLIGLVAPAHAGPSSFIPASACQPHADGDGRRHVHQTDMGVVNKGADTFNVVCPVVRPSGVPGLTVTVFFSVDPGVMMQCLLNSATSSSSFARFVSFTYTGYAGGPTVVTRTLTLSPEQAPYYSFQSLMCTLPGNRKVNLRGMVVESS